MITQHSSKFSRSTFVAALAALALAATACGGGGDSADAPLPTDAPTTTVVSSADPESAPETTSPPETTTSTTALEPEPGPEPEPEVATEPEPEQADEATEGHDEVEGFEDVEPVEQDVICGEGLTLMEEFVTDTDNGCRPETCEHGRTDRGDCQLPPEDEPMTAEEVAAVVDAEALVPEEYIPEGCTEVSLGVCEQDGLLFCHDTVEGWAECPGQPTGDPCEHDESNPLSVAGSGQITGEITTVSLSVGPWTATVCLTGNDLQTGQPEPFSLHLSPFAVTDPSFDPTEIVTVVDVRAEQSVIDGTWSHRFDVAEPTDYQVWATPEGGGFWVLTLSSNE